jgi:hypothetical protein
MIEETKYMVTKIRVCELHSDSIPSYMGKERASAFFMKNYQNKHCGQKRYERQEV